MQTTKKFITGEIRKHIQDVSFKKRAPPVPNKITSSGGLNKSGRPLGTEEILKVDARDSGGVFA